MDKTPCLLSCNHVVEFAVVPKLMDDALCFKCGTLSKMIRISYEWKTKCLWCQWGRSFGASETLAKLHGSKHTRTKTHVVVIFQQGEPDKILVYKPNVHLMTDVPAF